MLSSFLVLTKSIVIASIYSEDNMLCHRLHPTFISRISDQNVLFLNIKLSSRWAQGEMKACCLHEMLVITMLLARWRKDEGIQRCVPRYKNKGSVNSCFDEVGRVASEKEPSRHPVLRDPKVLPDVRNRPLSVREIVSHSNFGILLWFTSKQIWNLWFQHRGM